MGETPQLIPALLGLWRFYLLRAELVKARELAEQCLLLVQRVNDPARLIVAHDALGETLFFLGNQPVYWSAGGGKSLCSPNGVPPAPWDGPPNAARVAEVRFPQLDAGRSDQVGGQGRRVIHQAKPRYASRQVPREKGSHVAGRPRDEDGPAVQDGGSQASLPV